MYRNPDQKTYSKLEEEVAGIVKTKLFILRDAGEYHNRYNVKPYVFEGLVPHFNLIDVVAQETAPFTRSASAFVPGRSASVRIVSIVQ